MSGSNIKVFAVGFLAAMVVSASAIGGYFLGTKSTSPVIEQKIVANSPVITPTALPTPSPSINPPEKTATSGATLAAIDSSFRTKDFTTLSDYMSDNLTLEIYGSECCGKVSKAEAIKKMDYFKSSKTPWTFSLTNAVAVSLKKAKPENFKDALIGISPDRHAVGFILNNATFMIEKITFLADYKLLVPQ